MYEISLEGIEGGQMKK